MDTGKFKHMQKWLTMQEGEWIWRIRQKKRERRERPWEGGWEGRGGKKRKKYHNVMYPELGSMSPSTF